MEKKDREFKRKMEDQDRELKAAERKVEMARADAENRARIEA
jgi:hypothetical protein